MTTLKITKSLNGANQSGRPFVNYSLTVPAEIGRRLKGHERFLIEPTADGLLYRPISSDTHAAHKSYKVRGFDNGGTKDEKPFRAHSLTVPAAIAEPRVRDRFVCRATEDGIAYSRVEPMPAADVPAWMTVPEPTPERPQPATGPSDATLKTRERCIGCLRTAAQTLGESMTAQDYKAFARERRAAGLHFPDAATIASHLGGGWNDAKLLAGLALNQGRPPSLTSEHCLRAVSDVWDRLGREPREIEYRKLCRSDSTLPSHQMLRTHISPSWPEIIARARLSRP